MVYLMKTNKNRVLSFFLVLCLCLFIADQPAFAEASWPQCSGIQADGGILIDADSNAVLYEKNADQAYYPASITKILTALIIIENCDLDEIDEAVDESELKQLNSELKMLAKYMDSMDEDMIEEAFDNWENLINRIF